MHPIFVRMFVLRGKKVENAPKFCTSGTRVRVHNNSGQVIPLCLSCRGRWITCPLLSFVVKTGWYYFGSTFHMLWWISHKVVENWNRVSQIQTGTKLMQTINVPKVHENKCLNTFLVLCWVLLTQERAIFTLHYPPLYVKYIRVCRHSELIQWQLVNK